MRIHTQNNIKQVITTCFWFIIGFLIVLSGCMPPGGRQKVSRIRFSVQNTLPIPRKNVPIVLTSEQLRKVNPDFSFKAFSVVTGEAPKEVPIPAQADDLNYDGERDQISFLLTLEQGETKEISILYDPTVPTTLTLDINKQTRAGIFPELNAVAALESNLIAYILKPNGGVIAYGKKRAELFSVDAMFQGELGYGNTLSPEFRLHFETNSVPLSQNPQALRIEVKKPEQQWIIHDLENQESYFIRKSEEQLDLSKSIGLSLNALLDPENTTMVALTPEDGVIGCGGFALWDKEKSVFIPIPDEGDYVRILADGSIRSIVQRILPEWNVNGKILRLTSTTFIYGENPWLEHQLHVDGDLPAEYAIVAGIPNIGGTSGTDGELGAIWSWGTAGAGVALIYPTTTASELISTDEPFFPVTLNLDTEGRLSYRALAVWRGGIDGIETETEFADYVQVTATSMQNPPRIKFLPPEDVEK